jgi:NAD(P)-dependent dehydrogenase (short-subunit alcohol dehydrogenase family)
VQPRSNQKMLNQKEKDGTVNYSVINISTVQECTPMPFAAPYALSKGGIEMLTKTMTLEGCGQGNKNQWDCSRGNSNYDEYRHSRRRK